MKLIKCLDEFTTISWWNEYRKIANQAINIYNRWQLGQVEGKDAYVVFALSYMQITNDVNYSEEFDIMKEQFEFSGFDVSFYHGF